MKRIALPLLVAAVTLVGGMSVRPQPAEARGSRYAAGIVLGAVVGGLIAHEVYRRERRRSYVYHSYAAPRAYYGNGYSYGHGYSYRRHHHRHGW
jgi:uncharacterized protein YcfJ